MFNWMQILSLFLGILPGRLETDGYMDLLSTLYGDVIICIIDPSQEDPLTKGR